MFYCLFGVISVLVASRARFVDTNLRPKGRESRIFACRLAKTRQRAFVWQNSGLSTTIRFYRKCEGFVRVRNNEVYNEKKEQIMQACFECFAENGLHGTGNAAVAKYANVSKATLYV